MTPFKIVLSFLLSVSTTVFASQRFEFNYEIEIPKPTIEFEAIRVWVPIVKSNFEQELTSTEINSNAMYDLGTEKKYGNAFAEIRMDKNSVFPVKFTAKYLLTRKETTTVNLETLQEDKRMLPKEFLDEDFRVPVNGVIASTAKTETAGLNTPLEKIRKIYEYVVKNISYSKEGTGWGEGDAVWACTNKRGNCTDFHSLLIGMARSLEIPARFEIGFPINPEGGEITGYHCWARAFDPATGWIPMDASEAKKTGNVAAYFGTLPSDRVSLSTGRDLTFSKNQKANPVNFFIYPHIEVDGKQTDLPYTKKIYSTPAIKKLATLK